jgi:uracil DNA glycosylase
VLYFDAHWVVLYDCWQCRRVDKRKHLILTSPHPSPLSAHRG